MSPPCKCGSYATNHTRHGRDGTDGNLCDVCYWRKRAEESWIERESALRAALLAAKLYHDAECEMVASYGNPCNCGAKAHNDKIDAAINGRT